MLAEPPFVIESPSAAEQRVSFRVGDSWCRLNRFDVGAGMRLDVTTCQYQPSFAFAAVHPPAEVELTVSRGAVIPTVTDEGETFELGGNALQVSHIRRPLALELRPESPAGAELVSLSLSAARLRQLLGTRDLPPPFRELLASSRVREAKSQAPTRRVLRLLEEIVGEDVRGPGRLLWHEAKALELLALLTDELADATDAEQPRLSPREIERVERVRGHLVGHLQSPPTLAELARGAAMSETKLKGAFRVRFGTSVFAFLREARMVEARRLLRARSLNVTEIAQRVGYANPSKFAAAFRRQFGKSPSDV